MTLLIKSKLADSLRTVKSYSVRAYSSFIANVFDVPPRLLAFLCFLTLLAIPICWFNSFGGTRYLPIFIHASILAILGASWDLLVGRTGQVSLGHALFFGIGGYVSGILYEQLYGFSYYLTTSVLLMVVLVAVVIGVILSVLVGLRRSMRILLMVVLVAVVIGVILSVLVGSWITIPVAWVTVPIALAIGTLLALLIGLPALRVKGPYLGLFTLCIPLIVQSLVTWPPLYWLTHADFGIVTPQIIIYPLGTSLIIRKSVEYYFTLTLLFISAVAIYKVAISKTGIVFVSILDNELAAKACGINVTKYKLLSFAISGLFGVLAGCLYSHVYLPKVYPTDLGLTNSFLPIIVTYLGGLGTIYGPIVGAYIYTILDDYALPNHFLPILRMMGVNTPYYETKNLIFAVIVILLVIKWPRGIARTIVDKLDDLAKPRDIEERGPRIWKKYKKEQKESRLQKIFSRFKKKQEEKEVKT